jgi:hypothetical protein
MPTPWLKRIRETGQLTVFHKGSAWADSIHTAITDVNNLSLGVQLVPEKEEKKANIVLMVVNGPSQYTYYGDSTSTDKDFTAERLHGETDAFIDKKRNEIFFAVIFLPGKVPNPTKGQKEVIVAHELIHACGMVLATGQEHDSEGLMFADMQESGSGLIEYLHDDNAKAMPPIRVGAKTLCNIRTVWIGSC